MEAPLYPVIHDRDWNEIPDCVKRKFLPDDEQSPLIVTYATDPSLPASYLTHSALEKRNTSIEEIEIEALRQWTEAHTFNHWDTQTFQNGPEEALYIQNDDFTTSSLLLSQGHLKGLHEHFDERHLGIIIPKRGTVVVHPDFILMAELGRQLYRDARQKKQQTLSPRCFASYDAQVLGYVTTDYEKEHGPKNQLSDSKLTELATKVLNTALVMVGAKGKESAEILSPLINDKDFIAMKAGQKLIDEKLQGVTQLAEEEHGQIALLAKLSQALYAFDNGSTSTERDILRQITEKAATIIAENSGGSTFRMESVAGKHEESSLQVISGVLA